MQKTSERKRRHHAISASPSWSVDAGFIEEAFKPELVGINPSPVCDIALKVCMATGHRSVSSSDTPAYRVHPEQVALGVQEG